MISVTHWRWYISFMVNVHGTKSFIGEYKYISPILYSKLKYWLEWNQIFIWFEIKVQTDSDTSLGKCRTPSYRRRCFGTFLRAHNFTPMADSLPAPQSPPNNASDNHLHLIFQPRLLLAPSDVGFKVKQAHHSTLLCTTVHTQDATNFAMVADYLPTLRFPRNNASNTHCQPLFQSRLLSAPSDHGFIVNWNLLLD